MSPIEAAVLRSVVVPSALFAVAVFATGGLPGAWRARAQATALALAFVAGAYALLSDLRLPPADVNQSFSYAALLLGLFVWVAPRRAGPRYAVRALFTLAGLGLVLHHIAGSLAGPVGLRNLAAFACLTLGTWSITETAGRTATAATTLLLPLIAATAVSLTCLISGSAAIAQLVGVLCGLIGAGLAVAVIAPRRVAGEAFVPFTAAFVALAIAVGHFYLDVNPWRMTATAWPFAVLWARPWLPLPRRAAIETPVTGLLAAGPVGWFLYQVFQSAGPLY